MKKKFIIIPVPIYRVSVIIFFGASLEGMIKVGIKHGIEKKRFDKDWRKDTEELIEENTQGFIKDYGTDNKDVLIWMKKRPKKLSEYAVLYHELYHATDHVAKSRNFNKEDIFSEPRAYLFEYLLTEVSRILW